MSYTKDKSVWVNSAVHELNPAAPAGSRDIVYGGTRKFTRTRTGDRLKNWKSIIDSGGNATTNLTGTYDSLISDASLSYTSRYRINIFQGYVYYEYYGHYPLYVLQDSYLDWVPFSSNADARASNSFLHAVRETMVQVSGPTFLGELRESLQMIRKPAAGLQNLVSEYLEKVRKRKNSRGHGRNVNWAKDLSELWLEYAFGWVPLMLDIEDGLKAYNRLFDKPRIRHLSVGGKDFKRVDVTIPGTTLNYNGHMGVVNTAYKDQIDVVRIRGALRAQAATTAQDRLALFGFTPSEFIPTAWELLPWSFLVDYFACIGDVLEGVVTDTSSVTWVSKTQILQRDLFISCKGKNPAATVGSENVLSYSSNTATAHVRRRTISRVANAGVPLPTLSFRWPLSLGKLTNMTALLGVTNRTIYPQNPSPRNYRH